MPVDRFPIGAKVRLPGGQGAWVTVRGAMATSQGWMLFVSDASSQIREVALAPADADRAEVVGRDGGGDPARVLAGLWTRWMASADSGTNSTLLASSPLRPYPHQSNAVYGAMLPQPRLRFLLADEPGTGKTIMAGLYVREMQRLGLVRRALVVAPAGLVSKWQADFERFFGGELRRITNDTVQQHGLSLPHHDWVVSLELAASNPAVQEAIRVDQAGWDLVVFDEAHRLTPTAETFHRVGRLLAEHAPRALLMTATPHRGSERLFRHLLHLVDPEIFPEPPTDRTDDLRPIKPGAVHFLRRMKEDLTDYDGTTKLFKGRRAHNIPVPLNSIESGFYREALELVEAHFPSTAMPLAKMVYGKRAASSLYALAETLRRRRDQMGAESPTLAALAADPNGEDDWAAAEARVVSEGSRSARMEQRAIDDLLERIIAEIGSEARPPTKWEPLLARCLEANGIVAGGGEQAVVFTEFADTADWLVGRFERAGYSARRYSGRDAHVDRDRVRADFAARRFQVLVSTDAGNEGIDLQTAHVLVNYDIPWSLVRLEQRMGRIHRVGQTRDVELYNLVAVGTREGDVLTVLLDNFVAAANQLDGRLFDSLSLVAELVEFNVESALRETYEGDERRAAALERARTVTVERVQAAEKRARQQEAQLATAVNLAAAVRQSQADGLDRINPAIIEAFLRRLAGAGLLTVAPTASGDGILLLTTSGGDGLGSLVDGRSSVVVATSAKALADAQRASATLDSVERVGPGEATFQSLVAAADGCLAIDLYRGGTLTDPTSISDYDLFVFEAGTTVGDGPGPMWSALVRADDTGAREVRWELLANLEAGLSLPSEVHPGRSAEAREAAERLARSIEAEWEDQTAAWLEMAREQLDRLPSDLSSAISDRHERSAYRRGLEETVARRTGELREATAFAIGEITEVARAHVRGSGPSLDPTAADSERIAMRHVRDRLAAEGWQVADVSGEGRGYDLHATRGPLQRCVEVKGVWGSAASEGVRLTGNEVLVAAQQGTNAWLYVVDGCSDGSGRLFGAYPDPAARFGDLFRQSATFRVPGSALAEQAEEGAA